MAGIVRGSVGGACINNFTFFYSPALHFSLPVDQKSRDACTSRMVKADLSVTNIFFFIPSFKFSVCLGSAVFVISRKCKGEKWSCLPTVLIQKPNQAQNTGLSKKKEKKKLEPTQLEYQMLVRSPIPLRPFFYLQLYQFHFFCRCCEVVSTVT